MRSADVPIPDDLRRAYAEILDAESKARDTARILGGKPPNFGPAWERLQGRTRAFLAKHQVAFCPRCREWFPSLDDRAAHRAGCCRPAEGKE